MTVENEHASPTQNVSIPHSAVILRIGLETGTPVYVVEDGKIVDLTKRYRRKRKR